MARPTTSPSRSLAPECTPASGSSQIFFRPFICKGYTCFLRPQRAHARARARSRLAGHGSAYGDRVEFPGGGRWARSRRLTRASAGVTRKPLGRNRPPFPCLVYEGCRARRCFPRHHQSPREELEKQQWPLIDARSSPRRGPRPPE